MTGQAPTRNPRILVFVLLLIPLGIFLAQAVRQCGAHRAARRARAEQGNLPEAARWMTRAADILPWDADAWSDLGSIYQLMAGGEESPLPERIAALKEAETAFARSIEEVPTSAASHINLGWTRYQLDQLEGRAPGVAVKRSFELAARLDPFNYYPHYLLGDYLLHEGDLQGAFREYREAIRAYPHDEVIRAVVHKAVARTDDYGLLAQLVPENTALAHRYLATALLEKLGRWDLCQLEFRKIFALEPRNTYYRDWHLRDCMARQDVDAAVREVQARQELLGPEPEVLLRLAEFLKKQGEWDRALEVCLAAREIAPDHPGAAPLLAEIRAGRGDILEAVNAYEAHLKTSPRDPEAAFRLAEIYREHGSKFRAAELFSEAAFLAPREVRYQSRLADMYVQLGMQERALEVLERCKQLNPREVFFHIQAGRIRLDRKDWLEAAREFGEALKLDPGNQEALKGFLRAESRTPGP